MKTLAQFFRWFTLWFTLICGALLISVVIKNLFFMCLVALLWGMVWKYLFHYYVLPLINKLEDDDDES